MSVDSIPSASLNRLARSATIAVSRSDTSSRFASRERADGRV